MMKIKILYILSKDTLIYPKKCGGFFLQHLIKNPTNNDFLSGPRECAKHAILQQNTACCKSSNIHFASTLNTNFGL